MKKHEFDNLETGDIIRHVNGTSSYVVMANYGSRITAARTVDLTNPHEWDLIYFHGRKYGEDGDHE